MMHNITVYLLESSIVFSLLFVSTSCEKQQFEKTYYYAVTAGEDTIPYLFFATEISEKDDIRKVIEYSYSVYQNAIVDTLIEYYKLKDKELYKLRNQEDDEGECFLTVKSDTCVVFNHPDSILNSMVCRKHCFLGKETIKTAEAPDSIDAYVFLREVGQIEPLIFKVYYNRSFVLVKEEYIRGDRMFRGELVNSIPEEFSNLLHSNLK